MRSEEGPARLVILPAKFVGGLLSLGSGMALGREGPTVQMGASLAGAVGRAGRLGAEDVRDLSAAAGGAGLAVAFNAPLGGILFVLEEVSQAFRVRLVLATLVAVGVAVAAARLLIGMEMTATTSLLVPMVLASMTASAVCLALRSAPIYDSLRVRTEAAESAGVSQRVVSGPAR